MNFQVTGLDAEPFRRLYGLDQAALQLHGAVPYVADANPGFPCRVSLRDAEPGERLLLLNYQHQPVSTPYRSSHAIFVIDGATPATAHPGEVPDMLAGRQLSVRAFDALGMMTDALVTDGSKAADVFHQMLESGQNAYLHVHTAARGCYLARIIRS